MSFFNKNLSQTCLFICLLAFSFSFNVAFASEHDNGLVKFRDKTKSKHSLQIACLIDGGDLQYYDLPPGGTVDVNKKDILKTHGGYRCLINVDTGYSKVYQAIGCANDAGRYIYFRNHTSIIKITRIWTYKNFFRVNVSCN